MESTLLEGWVPIRVYWNRSHPFVDWCYLGSKRFTEPFFEQTIGKALHHPANALFRHQTPIERLEQLKPGISPTGFIFHMSRCGSTLIAQMLAALEKNIVISEAVPMDAAMRMQFGNPAITDSQRIDWLRGIVNALGQRRTGNEQYHFIKFDSWHTLFLPLIRKAFPDVPWIFLYRDPVEVMVSHHNQTGTQMIPGVLQPEIFGLTRGEPTMSLEEYCACVLQKICEAALVAQSGGGGMLVNYLQLPHAVWPALTKFWRADFSGSEMETMLMASRFSAKNPSFSFESDTERKRREATEVIRHLSEQKLGGLFQKLENERLRSE
ncbi:MAG: aspartyl/asparaginyl beta-hydroxylase [Verrucomicrobiales bacterium]|nr:aspartyl/asparaginyl beta-hydroxylase [Verrucomicrobiales bacterium]